MLYFYLSHINSRIKTISYLLSLYETTALIFDFLPMIFYFTRDVTHVIYFSSQTNIKQIYVAQNSNISFIYSDMFLSELLETTLAILLSMKQTISLSH